MKKDYLGCKKCGGRFQGDTSAECVYCGSHAIFVLKGEKLKAFRESGKKRDCWKASPEFCRTYSK